jgi:acetyl-CoA synthetase
METTVQDTLKASYQSLIDDFYFSLEGAIPTEKQRAELWQNIAQSKLAGEKDFGQHLAVYRKIFGNNPAPAAWIPDAKTIENSNIGQAMKTLGFNNFADFHHFSRTEHDKFWEYTIEKLGIIFHKKFDKVIDNPDDAENARWLTGAELNIADSCFRAEKDKTAIYTAGEGTEITAITYGELEKLVNRAANGFYKIGLQKGDRVIIYMPLSAEAVILYLGMVRAGIQVVSVADSFSTVELEKRCAMIDAKAVCTTDGYQYAGKFLPIFDKVKAGKTPRAILVRYGKNEPDLRENDILYNDFLSENEDFTSVKSDAYGITNILFSSGTTKEPKAIPWTHLTPIKGASDGFYHHDIKAGDVVTWTTSMGWMMGPWVMYAAFINRASLALFTGSAASEEFGEFAQETGITMMGTIPSLVKVWRKNKSMEKYQWKVRVFSSTGEPSNAEDYLYLMSLTGYRSPVIEYCGGTEIGGGYITGSVVQAASPSVFTTPALGLNFVLFDEENQNTDFGQIGQVFLQTPALGISQSLLNKNHHEEYFAGCPLYEGRTLRRHGDAFLKDKQAYDDSTIYRSTGRVDDAMNIGGIKVSAVEIEETVNQHPLVFESAAIAVQEENGGPEQLIVYYVPKSDIPDEAALHKEIQKMLATEMNPLFRLSKLIRRPNLPRTASNKIMRRELRKEYLESGK